MKRGFTLAGATHVDKSDNKRKLGFTLAEVLITLGIIGVVAVLTVPNIVSNYQKKVYVAQLQKVYNQLSNAVNLMLVDEEVETLWGSTLADEENGAEHFLSKYFKISKVCGNSSEDDMSDCFADTYSNVSKSERVEPALIGFGVSCYAIKLNSGTSICLSYKTADEEELNPDGTFDEHASWDVFIDLNGTKGPNVLGKDYYGFYLYSDGKIQGSYENSKGYYCNTGDENNAKVAYGVGCLDRIIDSGWKMDY